MPSDFWVAFFVMNRLERITSILLMLQSRRKITAQQLADHFETSVRTIYRDVRVLEEAGVPVGAEAGVGYFIMDGYSLPPVMFTREEAAAMLTGEKLLHRFGDASVNREFKTAMHKIRSVLRSGEKEFLETLEQSMAVYGSRKKQADESFPDHFISSIQQALVKQQVIEIDYYAVHSEETSKRKVEPIGLSHMSGHWHLYAWCRLRGAVRDFRSDRIKTLRLLDEHYDKQKLPTLDSLVCMYSNPENLHRIEIRVDRELARGSAEMKHWLGLVEERKQDDYSDMVFLHYSLPEFARWLLLWGNKATVTHPPELREILSSLSKELAEHHT
jgi:predicted DNA-binding transcriptional regulator YafY